MNRAEFRCEYCQNGASTLNVHHLWYEKGRYPWDYPSTALVCVCEECHDDLHERMRLLQVLSSGMGWDYWEELLGLANKLRKDSGLPDPLRDSESEATEPEAALTKWEVFYARGIGLVLRHPEVAASLLQNKDFKSLCEHNSDDLWVILREIIYSAGYQPKSTEALLDAWRDSKRLPWLRHLVASPLFGNSIFDLKEEAEGSQKYLCEIFSVLLTIPVERRTEALLDKAGTDLGLSRDEKVELSGLLKLKGFKGPVPTTLPADPS